MLGHHHPEVEAAVRAPGKPRRLHERTGRGDGRARRASGRHGRPCRLGPVPEERHRCDDDLRHHRACRHRPAQAAGSARRLPRRRALVLALPRRRDRRGPGPCPLLRLQRSSRACAAAAASPATTSPAFSSRLSVTTSAATRSCRRGPLHEAARAACDAKGAALIMDDVRAGFRLHLAGSWEHSWRSPGPRRLEQGDRQRPSARRRHRARMAAEGRSGGLRDRLVLVRRSAHGGRRRDPRPCCAGTAWSIWRDSA